MFAAGKAVSGADPTDAQFNYVTMLLHGDGTNGAQNNTFLDSSASPLTITRNGNTTQGTFTPYGSNWSNYFDGNGDYLTFPSNATFAFGTGDFTVSFWVNEASWSPTGGSNYAHWISINSYTTGVMIRPNLTGTAVEVWVGNTQYSFTTTLSLGTWYHIAVSRSSSSMRLFVNGTQVGSTQTVSYNISTNTSNTIGTAVHSTTEVMQGYLSNLRIVSGLAVYTTAFTPSTTPLTAITNTSLLTCQSNRFIDNSSNNFTITKNGDVSVQRFSPFSPTTAYSTSVIGGSGYFDGSGDYLTLPAGNSWLFTGDHCLEAWVYWTASQDSIIYATGNASSTDQFGLFTGGEGIWWGVTSQSSVVLPTLNAWNHVCVTRQGTTIRRFLNGQLITTSTVSGNIGSNSATPYIGRRPSSGVDFIGNMGDLRIINGSVPTSYQTSSTTINAQIFTPTTAPLTTTSQGATSSDVKLLLSYTNAGILDNAMMNDLETVGNAQISTSVVKYGTGSIALDGTDDRLNMPSSPNLAFGTGDFTLECWAYFTSVASFPTITDSRVNTSSTAGFNLGLSTAKVQLYTTSQLLIGSSTLSTNTWYHIAVTRASGTLKIWLNGVQDATVSNSTNWSDQSFVVGATPNVANLMSGYIDDLRLTKGFCRYTATFTPPTAAFADKG